MIKALEIPLGKEEQFAIFKFYQGTIIVTVSALSIDKLSL